jgi:DNA-binding MarR family transcriptional regulator
MMPTPRQRILIDFVTGYIKRTGKSPTHNEIRLHMACSRQNVSRMVAQMMAQGLIWRIQGRARRNIVGAHA